MTAKPALLNPEFRVVRSVTPAGTFHVTRRRSNDLHELPFSADYQNRGSAERKAWALAFAHVARTTLPVLVFTRTGAFEIHVGTYPQDGRRG